MPITDMLVDSTANNELMSFMDGFFGCNKIVMPEGDISKTTFRCPGSIGTFEWSVMSFSLKNASVTYQRAMNVIFHDMQGHHVEEVYTLMILWLNLKESVSIWTI